MRSVQAALVQGRASLLAQGVLHPEGFGTLGQPDLLLTALTPAEGHPLAVQRGLAHAVDLQEAQLRLRGALAQTIVQHRPRVLLLSMDAAALWADTPERLGAVRAALSEFTDDIVTVLHLAAPSEALADAVVAQVALGRRIGLAAEESVVAAGGSWFRAASALRMVAGGLQAAGHPLVQTATPAVDAEGLVALWQSVFGADAVTAREFDADAPKPADLAAALDDLVPGWTSDAPLVLPHRRPSIPALRRMLALNAALAEHEVRFGAVPSAIRERLLQSLIDDGKGLTGADLSALTQAIRPLKSPRKTVPDLSPDPAFDPTPLLSGLTEEAASLQAAADAARTARLVAQGATSTAKAIARDPAPAAATPTPKAEAAPPARRKGPEPLSPAAEALLSPAAKDVFKSFQGGRYWPRNTGVVGIDETMDQPPFPVDEPPKTGTLIVGCMKNEGPYILEWVAYHKAIGVDHFLIFTNDCSDGTDEILKRLMALGHLTHESNDEWKGKSPQQAALNKAMKMDVVKDAEWLIHIDVDEYINVRKGNGTLADLYAGMGDATNLAMTWRLFGNAGQEEIGEATVIDRFTGCAPAYVPKPHTMWGFKSITRNVGAYDKLSCHRPNQLAASHKETVRWLNGNLQDHTKELADKGWRSSIQSIGYDAVQLNHYALRSRESFLIKRQRGRALHVDRSIGLNYWVRHDWHLNTDRSILRQVPRTWAMKAKLLEDPELARLQAEALAWHHAKAKELRETDAFAELWEQTKRADLTDGERMAFAVAEDLES